MLQRFFKWLHTAKYGPPDLIYWEERVQEASLVYYRSNAEELVQWYRKYRPWTSGAMIGRDGKILAEKHFRKMVWFIEPGRYEEQFLRWIEVWPVNYEPMREAERR